MGGNNGKEGETRNGHEDEPRKKVTSFKSLRKHMKKERDSERIFYSSPYYFENVRDKWKNLEKMENYGIIPSGILQEIFSFSPLDTILECLCCCNLFRCIIDTQNFWKNYLFSTVEDLSILERIKSKNIHNWKEMCLMLLRSYKFFGPKDRFYEEKYFDGRIYMPDSHEGKINILLLGDGSKTGVGKSSLIDVLEEKDFSRGYVPDSYLSHESRSLTLLGKPHALFIYEARNLKVLEDSKLFGDIRFFHGIMLCFSVDSIQSFESTEKKLTQILTDFESRNIVIVGCKSDLREMKKSGLKGLVEYDRILEFLEKYDMNFWDDYCECSSMDLRFIHLPFGMLIQKILKGIQNNEI